MTENIAALIPAGLPHGMEEGNPPAPWGPAHPGPDPDPAQPQRGSSRRVGRIRPNIRPSAATQSPAMGKEGRWRGGMQPPLGWPRGRCLVGTRPPRCRDGATASPPCTCHGVLPWELPAQLLPGRPRRLACAWGCVRNVSEEGGTGTLSVPVAALNKALRQRSLAGGGKRAALGTGCPPVHPQPLCPSLGVPGTGDMFVPPSSHSSRALLACRGLGESQPGAATVWRGGLTLGTTLLCPWCPSLYPPQGCPHPHPPMCPQIGSPLPPPAPPPSPACSPLTSGGGRGLSTSFPAPVLSPTTVLLLSLCPGGIPRHCPPVGSQHPASMSSSQGLGVGMVGGLCRGLLGGSRQSRSLLPGQEPPLPAELAQMLRTAAVRDSEPGRQRRAHVPARAVPNTGHPAPRGPGRWQGQEGSGDGQRAGPDPWASLLLVEPGSVLQPGGLCHRAGASLPPRLWGTPEPRAVLGAVPEAVQPCAPMGLGGH